ncbi:MAG: non-canonical purine NTP pyrophosphatase, partial [Candidatus Omnitrophica bacterium]|nr:non-canonical purine NTP pyrophosphatase [Candidatus Omnitrophota bacterium]
MKLENGLVIATRNKKKKEEIVSILSDLKLRLYTLDEFENVPEVVEDKDTLEGNAIKKAVEAALNIKKI